MTMLLVLSAVSYVSSLIGDWKKEDPRKRKSNGVRANKTTIEDVLTEFYVSDTSLRRFMTEMSSMMDKGLEYGSSKSSIAMLPSFVWKTVDCLDEPGKYLAMDLGGTNLRCLLYEVNGKHEKHIVTSRSAGVPGHAMRGTAEQLFDFIAHALGTFLQELNLLGANLPLGFTFSYPCDQTSIRSAKLLKWTKGFDASGVVGNDVVKLLEAAIERHGEMAVRVVAILNDTVGTLMSAAIDFPEVYVGVIVATGTNCAYIESTKKFPMLAGNKEVEQQEEMIIDTEWGAFGDFNEIEYVKNDYDRLVDSRSVHPGSYTFDKLIAGMYMGEYVRLALERLIDSGIVFDGAGSEYFHTPDTFPTKLISEILNDESPDLYHCREVLSELGVEKIKYQDMLIVREVCMIVSKRSAKLCAAGIATVLNRMQKKNVTVGIDGSTYWFHPFFNSWVEKQLVKLIDPGLQFKLVRAGDGSGKGAALVAASAC